MGHTFHLRIHTGRTYCPRSRSVARGQGAVLLQQLGLLCLAQAEHSSGENTWVSFPAPATLPWSSESHLLQALSGLCSLVFPFAVLKNGPRTPFTGAKREFTELLAQPCEKNSSSQLLAYRASTRLLPGASKGFHHHLWPLPATARCRNNI